MNAPQILSKTNIRLLAKLCNSFGNAKKARKDPNLVLRRLLIELNRTDSWVALGPSLDCSIGWGLNGVLEKKCKKKDK